MVKKQDPSISQNLAMQEQLDQMKQQNRLLQVELSQSERDK